MLTAIIIAASITQIVVSLFVLLRGWRNLSNLLFFFLGITTLCWALVNYLTIILINSPDLLYLVRTILFFVVIQNAFFYMFARTFPEHSWKHSRKWLLAYGVFTALAASATLSPFVFTTVKIEDGLPITEAGPGIMVFILHASLSIGLAFKALAQRIRRASGVQKSQIRILLYASLINWVLVPITNFVLTPLLKTTTFIVASPLYTLAFAGLIAYAIIARRLFDIRAAVARALAYILSLATIVASYALLAFVISGRIFSDIGDAGAERGFYIGLAVVSSLFYPSVKQFFDRVTNRIFFQDAYDPQAFIDQLNRLLVSNVELESLLQKSVEVIDRNLKCEYTSFIVRETAYTGSRNIGSRQIEMGSDDMAALHVSTPSIHHRVIMVDELADDPQYKRLYKVLREHDVAVLVRLVATLKYDVEGVGYLLLGQKKSGNPYTDQDVKIIRIIANELVIAVENALRFEEIENFNLTLQHKVEEATKQLRRTNEKLKALDETKDEFISMASHQLRTPLTSVKGYLSMVLEGDAGKLNEMQEKLLNQAFVSSQRMVYLIADLLNVSRLRTGKFVIEQTPVNLADVIEGEVQQLHETAESRQLKLIYAKPADFPQLMLDETKIRQVIMNFIDNAIYYTPEGGTIDIRLEDTGESLNFTVNDSGIGVPKSEQPHLFSKFYRAANAKKARPDGTGLGLFMAKKVVIAQGGAIIFKSQEGKGSTFGFTFDKKKLQPPVKPGH
jgi:signal transduction histidine kinase